MIWLSAIPVASSTASGFSLMSADADSDYSTSESR